MPPFEMSPGLYVVEAFANGSASTAAARLGSTVVATSHVVQSAAIQGNGSKITPRLARAKHPQHQDVASSFVVAGIGADFVQSTVAAVAGSFPHAWMLPSRIDARAVAQSVYRRPDRREPASGP